MQFLKDNKLIAGALAVIIALAAWMVLSGRVHAADKGGLPRAADIFADQPVPKISWSGVYVGLHGGYNSANIELSVGPLGVDGLSATGFSGGVDVGADVQLPHSCLVLGARAGYTMGSTEFTVTPGLFAAKIRNGWNVDGRIGCALGTALPYLFVGYVQDDTAATGLADKTRAGWRGGGGIELRLPTGSNIGTIVPTVALEYIHTDYNDFMLGPVNVNLTDESVMLRLNLRFQ